MSNNKLVYTTDPKEAQKCPKCKEYLKNCECEAPQAVESRNFKVVMRIEKSGRGGKTVTVLDGFPKNEIFLKELTKELKQSCGVGGTYLMSGKEGIIEIQGDKRDVLKNILIKKNMKVVG